MFKSIKFFCIILALTVTLTSCANASVPNTSEVNELITNNNQELIKLNVDDLILATNEYRTEQGLSTLQKDEILCEVAEIRAKEIVNVWSHTRPDGTKFYNILENMDYKMGAAGENLGRYQKSIDEVMEMWKKSSSHNKNMLSNYTRMGAAIYEENGLFYFVQIFTR